MNHLGYLELSLSNERIRLGNAKTFGEQAWRRANIRKIEKEIAGEIAFLGKQNPAVEMSDDELMNALQS